MPSYNARMQYIEAVYNRYQKANKEEKGRILQELCKVCHYNRKYAIRKLNGPRPQSPLHPVRRRRAFRYGVEALQLAEMIWKASGYLCGQRLKEAIPLWLPALKKRLSVRPGIEQQLLSISSRQLDQRLQAKKRFLKRRFYGTTRPGTLLRRMIAVRTSNYDIRQPGFLELDLVAHCGRSLQGQFVYTLDATDVQTGWTERRAVLGKSQHRILTAVEEIRQALPFRLRGIDSDNGEEFINWQLLRWCRSKNPAVCFTRGRTYRKNDNAYVEQKNWTHVRQIFRWDRYESDLAVQLMNDLYRHELCWLQNLFQPSLKLKTKTRLGSKVLRRYDTAKTPLQRLVASRSFNAVKVKALQSLQNSLDPFDLAQRIDRKIARISRLASQPLAKPVIAMLQHPQTRQYTPDSYLGPGSYNLVKAMRRSENTEPFALTSRKEA